VKHISEQDIRGIGRTGGGHEHSGGARMVLKLRRTVSPGKVACRSADGKENSFCDTPVFPSPCHLGRSGVSV